MSSARVGVRIGTLPAYCRFELLLLRVVALEESSMPALPAMPLSF
jgi:hypothetical protein